LRPIKIEIEISWSVDQLLKLVEISLTVETRLFFFSGEIFKIETFQSRLSCVKIFIETVKINWDCQHLLRLFEIYWDIWTFLRLFEGLQAQKSWQIEKPRLRNMIKLTNSWSRSRQTVGICQKFQVSTDFSISIKTFGTGRWCQDKIKISWSVSRLLNCWDKLFEIVEIFSTVETCFLPVSRQTETPRLKFYVWGSFHVFKKGLGHKRMGSGEPQKNICSTLYIFLKWPSFFRKLIWVLIIFGWLLNQKIRKFVKSQFE
jgi:hypothetical protein